MLDSDQDTSISTRDGLLRIRHYVLSLDRYGPSPFLYPMYGSSELSQAYCRVSAVYGSTFVLRRGVSQIYMSSSSADASSSSSSSASTVQVQGIKCSMGQDLLTQHLVMNRDFVPTAAAATSFNHKGESVLRCINILNTPMLDPVLYKQQTATSAANKVQYGAFIAVVPPKTFGANQTHAITIVQMDNSASVVPRGKHLVTFEMRGNDFEVLKQCVNFFLKPEEPTPTPAEVPVPVPAAATTNSTPAEVSADEKQDTVASEASAETPAVVQQQQVKVEEPVKKLVYQLYYKYYNRTSVADTEADKLFRAGNVHVADDIDCLADMEKTVAQARTIFDTISPNSEFLPRLPNPEEQEDAKNQVFDVAAKLLGVDKEMEQQQQAAQQQEQTTSTANAEINNEASTAQGNNTGDEAVAQTPAAQQAVEEQVAPNADQTLDQQKQ